MKHNELTDVIETKQGYLVFQVLEHYDEGEQSFEKVKNEIMDRLYNSKLEPVWGYRLVNPVPSVLSLKTVPRP